MVLTRIATMRFSFFLLFISVSSLGTLSGITSAFADNNVKSDIEADKFIYDQDTGVITAQGNVILVQNGQTLIADEIIYNVANDASQATGNVRFDDGEGNIHYAKTFELTDQMQKGLINSLYSELNDGSRMWASRGVRETPEKHILKDARYTPCKACEENPDEVPSWAIRAAEVNHNKNNAMISYKDVRFEAWGAPVFYFPYFSHPDGTIPQKSGFLTPSLGFGSDYGFNAEIPYYWAISPSQDATIGTRFFTKSAPQLNLETRKRFENASIRTAGSVTYSDRKDRVGDDDVYVNEELRGHFEVDSIWNMNRNWRAGTDIKLASDEQYLEQYDIEGDEDVLTNRIYAERFENRDYASVELLAFQDLRLDRDVDQPHALPFANMSFVGAPNSVGGGRFKWDSSFLTLFREGNEQDVNRVNSRIAWQRQDILPSGVVSKVDLSVRGDAYYTNDRDIAKIDPNEDDTEFDNRLIPTANIELGYPLHKQLESAQIRVKPKLGLTARPDVDNDSSIPNEDSIDAQIDITNLFEADRFPGLDRVEDRTRVNYGVESGYYNNNGDEFVVSLGQSYRLENEDNPFPNGSGFEEQESDVVGMVSAGFDNYKHNINYRFQLNGQKLNAERHEIFGTTGTDKTRISGIYLYERGSEGTEFEESREQIQASVTQVLNQNWSASAAALYDLGEDSGLRQSLVGLSYDDDCFGVTTELRRELQREASGTNDTTVLMRFRLKNLGEFETTAYDYGSGDDDRDANDFEL